MLLHKIDFGTLDQLWYRRGRYLCARLFVVLRISNEQSGKDTHHGRYYKLIEQFAPVFVFFLEYGSMR